MLYLAVKSHTSLLIWTVPQSLSFLTITFLEYRPLFCKYPSIGFLMFAHGLTQVMHI